MKLFLKLFVGATLGLLGCAQETSLNEADPLPKIFPVVSIPLKGEVLSEALSSHSEISQELRKFSEDDYEIQNLDDLSKLKALRERYKDSLVGSGSIFAISPEYERDYIIRESSDNLNIVIKLPDEPYLSYYCENIELGATHFETVSYTHLTLPTKA